MSSRSLTGSVSFALLVVVAAAGVFATAGSAKAPGKNGPIAFFQARARRDVGRQWRQGVRLCSRSAWLLGKGIIGVMAPGG
jgi:hypothetical protein